MNHKKHKLVVILGPTSSGKSDLAVSLAKRFNGEIISADSRQVYRGMDLGTGKVPRDKIAFHNSMELWNGYFYSGVRHHLLDVSPPKHVFTAEEYKKKASKAIVDIWKREKLPILCGGTGFYIDAVVYGAEFPNVPPSAHLRRIMRKKTTDAIFTELLRLDPERAGVIDPKNRHRVMRSLEIVRALGRVPKIKSSPIPAEVLFIGIKTETENLKKRIEVRLKKRVKLGMLAEIKKLHESGVSWKRLESFGLEYRWGAKLLKHEISKAEFFAGLARDIIRYAKRQMTWFKRNANIHWIKTEREAIKLTKDFF